MIVTPHLQAYYRFENNGLDSSGKGNHLTAVGATYGAGKVGNGAIYDGVDDLHNGGNILNAGLDNWFISLWIKPDKTTGTMGVLSKGAVGGIPNRYVILYDSGSILIVHANTIFSISASNTPVGEWTNMMWNIDRSGVMTMYVNLTLKGSANISTQVGYNMISNYPFRVGSYSNSNNPVFSPLYYFKGQIDEVLMYNKTMNETDRKRIFCNIHPLNG